MTRVDSADRIAQIIRRHVDALREPAQRRLKAAADRAGVASEGPAAQLGEVIARRIKGIDAADPERRRKAFRVFLESVLLAELGDALINDPGFYQLVEQVQSQMEADADLARAMDEAGLLLLRADR